MNKLVGVDRCPHIPVASKVAGLYIRESPRFQSNACAPQQNLEQEGHCNWVSSRMTLYGCRAIPGQASCGPPLPPPAASDPDSPPFHLPSFFLLSHSCRLLPTLPRCISSYSFPPPFLPVLLSSCHVRLTYFVPAAGLSITPSKFSVSFASRLAASGQRRMILRGYCISPIEQLLLFSQLLDHVPAMPRSNLGRR